MRCQPCEARFPALPRHALPRRFMAHGLVDVGQRALAGSPLPWWLTFGTVPGGR